MNDHIDEKLNGLLQTWSDANTADETRLESLHQRIISSMGDVSPMDESSRASRQGMRTSDIGRRVAWEKLSMIAMSAAAVLLLVLVVASLFRQNETTPQSAKRVEQRGLVEGMPHKLAWISEEQMADKRALLDELSRVFDNRLTWVAEVGDQVRLGPVNEDQQADAATRPLAIRVVLIRKTERDPVGTSLWEIDLLTHNEQVVRVKPSDRSMPDLSLWAFVLPDGNVAIDTDLSLPQVEEIRPKTSTVQTPGKPNVVYTHKDDQGEYVMYQMVSTL